MILPDINDKSIYVYLNADDLEYCHKIAKIRCKYKKWAKKGAKNDRYDKGILNSDDDPYRTERIGIYGEKAFNLITGLPIDEEERPKGDPGWDFILPDSQIKIDPKHSLTSHDTFYIKAAKSSLKPQKPKSDFYVFSYNYNPEGLAEKDARDLWIKIVGVISKKSILENAKERIGKPLVKSGFDDDGKPKWLNYYIKKEELIDPITFFWNIRKHMKHEQTDLYLT
jgi:hypothetical protein